MSDICFRIALDTNHPYVRGPVYSPAPSPAPPGGPRQAAPAPAPRQISLNSGPRPGGPNGPRENIDRESGIDIPLIDKMMFVKFYIYI